LLELLKCDDANDATSAFVGNTVHRAGCLYLLVDVDINLILLDLLEKQRSAFVPIEQLLRVETFPHYTKFLLCPSLNAGLLADFYEPASAIRCVLRLNDEKALSYLKSKVRRTAKYLLTTAIDKMAFCGTTNSFNNLGNGSQDESYDRVLFKESERIAIQLLLDYLPERWRQKLAEAFGWTVQRVMALEPYRGEANSSLEGPKREATWEEENGYIAPGAATLDAMRFGTKPDVADGTTKRRRIESYQPGAVSAATKKLAQVNRKGVPSIASFFVAKS
jgi:hypothetical protein